MRKKEERYDNRQKKIGWLVRRVKERLQTPAYTSKQYSKKFLRHIFHQRILNINNIRNDLIEICTKNSPKEIRA